MDHSSLPETRPAAPRRHPRSRGWAVGAALLATVGALAACSSTPSSSGSPTTTGGSTTASTAPPVAVVASATRGSLGTVLVTADGRTLYRLTTDTPTSSSCTGGCAQLWPPLTVAVGTIPRAASGLTGTVRTIARSDGSLQVTYQGHPLYTYAQDTTTSDALGQGVGGVWFIVDANGSVTSGSSTTATTARGGVSGY